MTKPHDSLVRSISKKHTHQTFQKRQQFTVVIILLLHFLHVRDTLQKAIIQSSVLVLRVSLFACLSAKKGTHTLVDAIPGCTKFWVRQVKGDERGETDIRDISSPLTIKLFFLVAFSLLHFSSGHCNS